MKRMTMLSCLLAVGCTSGDSSAPGNKAGDKTTPVQPKMQLMIVIYDQPGPKAQSRQIETFDDPGPDFIEKKVRALDWNDPQRVPLVNLGWASKGPFNSFSVAGLLGSANEDHAARANWVSFEDSKNVLRKSTPLKSLDQAVELLLLAHKQNEGKLRALQEWKVITPK